MRVRNVQFVGGPLDGESQEFENRNLCSIIVAPQRGEKGCLNNVYRFGSSIKSGEDNVLRYYFEAAVVVH
jgi:hypothetical protein